MSDDIEQTLEADPRYQALSGPDRVLKRKQVYEKLGMKPPEYIAKPGTRELDEEGPVHKYVRPVLEGAGMAGGIVLGAPVAPPFGAAGGGALGFAAGDTLASFAERMAGERPPISSAAQAGRETLEALKGGGMAEAGGRLFGKIGSKIADTVLAPFSKQYEGVNRTVDEMAKERGITLDPHEVLQSRPLALGHKVLENVPFTSGMVQRNELKKLESLTKEWQRIRDAAGAPDRQRLGEIGNEIQTEIEKHLNGLGVRQEAIRGQMRDEVLQAVGSPVTFRELGETSQKAVQERYQGLKAVENAAWDYAREAVPEGRVINENLSKTAQAIKKEYENFPSFLDEPLIKQLNDVAKSGNPEYDRLLATIPDGLPGNVRAQLLKEIAKEQQPGWTVTSLLKLRSALSEAVSEHHTGLQRGDAKMGSADKYGKIYTQLIKAIDQDLQGFADRSGSDIANRFKLARAASGERLSLFNPKDNPWVVKTIEAEAATLDRALILPGNAAGYTALKEKVGDAAARPVKQAFTNRLLGVGGKEESGLAGLRTTLDRYGKQTLAEVYTPAEIKDLYALADKSNWMKKSPIGNPFFRELIKTAPSKVAPTILEYPDLTAKILRTFPAMKSNLRQAFVEGVHPNDKTPFPTKLMDTLNAYPKEVQRQLFSQQELRDFHELAKIIERTKGTVKLAENPSGTAQNLVTFTTAGAIMKHPIKSIPHVLGTGALAKLYLSPAGRKYLLQGLVTPGDREGAASIATRIAGIAGLDTANVPKSEPNERYLNGQSPR